MQPFAHNGNFISTQANNAGSNCELFKFALHLSRSYKCHVLNSTYAN